VVGPIGQAEHRRTEKRGRVRGRMEVEIGSVGERLPALIGADQLDPSLPDLLPRPAVLIAKRFESPLRGHADEPCGLTMGLMMGLAWDKADELVEDIAPLGPRIDGVGGRERCQLIVFLAMALNAVSAFEAGNVRRATGR